MAKMDDAEASMARTLEEKTGKSLDAWIRLARAAGVSKHGELRDHLKNAHGLTHGYANFVVHKTLASDAGSSEPDALVDAQYAGAKAALKPLYEQLVKTVQSFGSDVEIAPKKGYVSVRRSKQFALIQPSTATRMDVGIVLKGVPPTPRLEAAGSFNAMVTHRVRLEPSASADKELTAWLKRAYEAG